MFKIVAYQTIAFEETAKKTQTQEKILHTQAEQLLKSVASTSQNHHLKELKAILNTAEFQVQNTTSPDFYAPALAIEVFEHYFETNFRPDFNQKVQAALQQGPLDAYTKKNIEHYTTNVLLPAFTEFFQEPSLYTPILQAVKAKIS